ncbi:MAG TPA: AMP-binding protein [Solirubrobacteraceae bacterium]|nr:AMP-binding protein [Solirubrobacteraceae bacterium]
MEIDPWLVRAAGAYPDRPALLTAAGSLTYAELETRARAAAGGLAARGVRAGERVALALPAGEHFAAALHGCLLLGAAVVPIDPRLGPAEREARLHGVAATVEEPVEGPPLASIGRSSDDRVAAVMYTSGSTAAPKPVSLTLANWLWNALGSALALGLDPEERWLCPMPLAHVGGLSILLRSAIYGTTVVLADRFDVGEVVRALTDPGRRITLVSLVPTMLSRLLDAGLERPPTLRWALLGGAPIPPALLDRARAAGVPVAWTYGMTEACSQIATRGWPLTGVELRIAGDGELLVRGPVVAPGALAPDGWLHTGDLGALDERGRLTVLGRRSDTIVTGGENVAPAEVEAVLLEHPAVADAAVHARPDAEWGERVVATVVIRDGAEASPEELRRHCAERLASFKVPKAVELADALPRNPAGKLLRRQLR